MLLISFMNQRIIANQLYAIEALTRSNYSKWKRYIELTLRLIDLDVALIEPKPDIPDANNSVGDMVKFEKWEKANRLSLMTIKKSILIQFAVVARIWNC